jgi:hypothetical protein
MFEAFLLVQKDMICHYHTVCRTIIRRLPPWTRQVVSTLGLLDTETKVLAPWRCHASSVVVAQQGRGSARICRRYRQYSMLRMTMTMSTHSTETTVRVVNASNCDCPRKTTTTTTTRERTKMLPEEPKRCNG